VALTLLRLVRANVTFPLVGVIVLIEDTLLAKSLVRLMILLSANEGMSVVCNAFASHLLSVLFQ